MGRGRPKGVKDSRPRSVNTTQKSKHNKGENAGTAAANGERSTTSLCSLSKMSKERGMLPRAALHQENVISNEQVKRQRVEAGQIASNFLGQYMVYPCLCFCHFAFITVTITHLCIFVVFFVKLPA